MVAYSYWLLMGMALSLSLTHARQIVEWTRKLDTCDPEDRAVTQGTTRFIYSFNDARPTDADNLKPHSPAQRGTTSARLFEKEHTHTKLPDDAEYFDVVMPPTTNITFFPQFPDTAYWCAGFKIPAFTQKVHVVRWEPVLQEDNLDVLHHMLVHDCPTMEDEDLDITGECGYSGATLPPRMIQCLQAATVGAWAVGGGAMDLPNNLGLPMEPGRSRYLLIQTHYNRVDPHRRPIRDNSGIRFWFTKQLRPQEAGIMSSGIMTIPEYTIPPGQKAFKYEGHCPSECTRKYEHPIRLVSTLLHAHNIGSALSIRHWRKGVEQPVIMNDPNYDFNFQDFERDPQQTVIYPGDEIHVTCQYDSSERTEDTPFGLSSQHEMCLAYMLYWPRLETPGCFTGYKNFSTKGQAVKHACCGEGIGCHDYEVDHSHPLPEPECTHVAPPKERTIPKFMKLSDFNPKKYNRSVEQMVNGRKVQIYWSINEKTKEIHFAADVDTNGWVGIGLSRNGGMPGSDIVTAHVFKNATGNWEAAVKDRIATAYAKPKVDIYQDLYDIRISYPEP